MGHEPIMRDGYPYTPEVSGFPLQGIYTQSVTQRYGLGTRYYEPHTGRTFRYAQNGAGTLVAGDLLQSAALGGAATTLQANAAVAVAAAAGDKRIYITALTTAQAVNLFAEGWAGFFDATAVGAYCMRVKDNSALATTGTTSYIDLYDGIPVALTTSDELALTTNLYKSVIQAPVSLTGAIVGGTPIAVTAAYYFWCQTKGMFAVHIKDGALVAGDPVIRAATTAGTVKTLIETEFQWHIGAATAAWSDEKSGFIMLNCE